MGNLRSVGGRGEVDLDQRAITTEDDIVDLSELDRSDDQPNQPAPATQNGAAEHDEPSEGQPPAAASRPHPPETPASVRESDEDFDRWVADRAPGQAGAVAASEPNTPRLAGHARDPASDDAPTAASRAAGVPCEEATVPPVTSSRSRLRRSGPRSRPLGRLARPAAVIGALTLSAGTAIAINAATWNATCAGSDLNVERGADGWPGQPGERRAERDDRSGDLRAPRARASSTPRAEHVASAPQAPAPPPEPQGRYLKPPSSRHRQPAKHRDRPNVAPTETYNSTPAPVTSSSTSQATAGSQTQATSSSRPHLGKTEPSAPAGAPPAPSKETPVQCSRPSPSSATTPSRWLPCS